MQDITSTNINTTITPDESGSIIFGESIKTETENKALIGEEKDTNTDNSKAPKNKNKKREEKSKTTLSRVIHNEIWLSVSEAAKIGGVQSKTIRRAIQAHSLKYKVVGNRYSINLTSLVVFLHTKKKLKNKLEQYGIGQYIKEWAE